MLETPRSEANLHTSEISGCLKKEEKKSFKYNSQKYDEAAKDQNLFFNYSKAHKIQHLGILTENKKQTKHLVFHP